MDRTQRHRKGVWKSLRLLRGGRLFIALMVGLMLAASAVAVGAEPPKAPATPSPYTCPGGGQCIGAPQIATHGTYADLSFLTGIAAVATVTIATEPANQLADGTLSYAGVPNVVIHVTAKSGQHSVHLDDLKPHTTYFYLINAAGPGTDTQRHGTFVTRTRVVTVKFDEIHVLDDTEDFGDGKMAFNFFPGTDMLNYPKFYPNHGLVTVAGGQSVTVNITTTLHDAPDSFDLLVEGYEDDSDAGAYPLAVYIEKVGVHGDRANAGGVAHVAKSGPGEAFSTSFTLHSSHVSGGGLKFDVKGSYTVSYE